MEPFLGRGLNGPSQSMEGKIMTRSFAALIMTTVDRTIAIGSAISAYRVGATAGAMLVLVSAPWLEGKADMLVGPSPYLCFDSNVIAGCSGADSPFSAIDFSAGYFYLEDLEDGVFDVPGATPTSGHVVSTVDTDSVDGDDGNIDGHVAAPGHSLAVRDLTITFDEGILGHLPTHVGIVATDILPPYDTIFQVFGPGMVQLNPGDDTFPLHFEPIDDQTAANDRFLGFTSEGGILAIRAMCVPGCGAEWDHVQYGYVPEAGEAVLIAFAFLGAWAGSLPRAGGRPRRH